MEDARFVSNYTPNGMFEDELKQTNHIQSNEDYRTYLTNNAKKIIHQNRQVALTKNANMVFSDVTDKNHGPYIFDTIYSESRPQGYETNKAKVLYLTRQQVEANKFKQYAQVN